MFFGVCIVLIKISLVALLESYDVDEKYLLSSNDLDTNDIAVDYYSSSVRVHGYELVKKIDDLGVLYVHRSDLMYLDDAKTITSFLLPFTQGLKTSQILNSAGRDIIEPVNILSELLAKQQSIQVMNKVKPEGNYCFDDDCSWYMKENIFHGGHGDVWRAYLVGDDGYVNQKVTYILKRMNIRRNDILECAIREIYFGNLFNKFQALSTTKLIRYFSDSENYWLVFRDEGISLQKLLYAMKASSSTVLLEPSLQWKKLRLTSSGAQTLKGIMHHLISAVADLHDRGVIHRDLKPNNILLNTVYEVKLIIGDFSSAINEESLKSHYGVSGPSIAEETLAYAPPEVLLSIGTADEIPYELSYPESFDIWSIGVIFLEVILGTMSVFELDQRSASLIARKLKRRGDGSSRRQTELLAAWADYCIYDPETHSSKGGESTTNTQDAAPMTSMEDNRHEYIFPKKSPRGCVADQFKRAILKRDPLGQGYHDRWGIDLMKRLLAFEPTARIPLREALEHAFFRGPYHCDIDDTLHATLADMYSYESSVLLDFIDASPSKLEFQALPPTDTDLLPLTHLKVMFPVVDDANVHGLDDNESTTDMPDDPVDQMIFTCPVCRRSFRGDWHACSNHVHARKHGSACTYNTSAVPSCFVDFALSPIHSKSGWCDLQGRRIAVEDFHSIVFTHEYNFFGVMDGHFGSQAAKFASIHIQRAFDSSLHNAEIDTTQLRFLDQDNILNKMNPNIPWQEAVAVVAPDEAVLVIDGEIISAARLQGALTKAFIATDEDLDAYLTLDNNSGTTVSIVVQFNDHILVGHVGDSRTVLCCDHKGRPVQLTTDHTPYDDRESVDVIARGGLVQGNIEAGELLRVNGVLAVTRSLGDRALSDVISASPDILLLRLINEPSIPFEGIDGNETSCAAFKRARRVHGGPFVILASDGLWDVLTNGDAADFACNYLLQFVDLNSGEIAPHSFQEAAKALAQEAFVRGSSDNIGVCVIDLTS